MAKTNYKDQDKKELEKVLVSKRLDLVKNQVTIASGKEKNLKKGWSLKKEIAQILTMLKIKNLES